MSSRRSGAASKFTQDELNDLVLKLQALLPQLNQRQASRVSVSKILQETCSYIRSLQSEADDLSEKLSQLLDSFNIADVDIETLRSNLQQ
ncbi:transcription factor PRE4 [Ricinus communis]|uniref:DNA binding protein, putative n=1 Tax=Ricinus communis TaxID=3988 RepID=B9R980_RICCO|nr:transcription factor PRE4 [Ricinus communis]EEF52157.1 DNA binding protein, putative [Ricinus communis]|eukprot:XP_025014836.1 transcription factor PRE4-like [Ricinus communis]